MTERVPALVIEDDPDAAAVAAGMLRVLGYEPSIAPDGHAALFALSEHPPALILLDICLPQMDGVTLMKVARRVEETRQTPVVACSAVYPPDSAVGGVLRSLGVKNYLAKPFNLAALGCAVKLAHPTGPAGSASLARGTSPASPAPHEDDSDPASETATLVLQLEDTVALVEGDGREVPMLVVRAADRRLDVQAAESTFASGDEVRASITIGEVVDDAMQRTTVRIVGRVTDLVTTPAGVRYRIDARMVNPIDGLHRVAGQLDRS